MWHIFQTSSPPSELPDDIDTTPITTMNTPVSPDDLGKFKIHCKLLYDCFIMFLLRNIISVFANHAF